jgi:hypothetical protein
MTDIPEEVLAVAKAMRATFGEGVRLKFAAWQGDSAGNPAYDNRQPGSYSEVDAVVDRKPRQ